MASTTTSPVLLTVGHSTRTFDELLAILRAHGVEQLVDVRTVPRSRRHPHFAQSHLCAALPAAGIAYRHAPALGGLRKPRPDSINTAWRNASFRGYADWMQGPEFVAAVDELLAVARERRTVVMCAEAVPWRCHRSLIGDAALARGFVVLDLMHERDAKPHALTKFAHVEGTRVTYPGETGAAAPPRPRPAAGNGTLPFAAPDARDAQVGEDREDARAAEDADG